MEQRTAVTIRFPSELLAALKETKEDKESLNDFVVEAVTREARRRQLRHTLARIREISDRVKARTGLHPDSVPLIHALREREGRRD